MRLTQEEHGILESCFWRVDDGGYPPVIEEVGPYVVLAYKDGWSGEVSLRLYTKGAVRRTIQKARRYMEKTGEEKIVYAIWEVGGIPSAARD